LVGVGALVSASVGDGCGDGVAEDVDGEGVVAGGVSVVEGVHEPPPADAE
jgi:hypothetical protein